MRNKIYTQCIRISFFFFAFIPLIVFSQPVAGDYRSNATSDWNLASTWQQFDGSNWVAAIAAPSATDGVITILSSHTVTANTVINADQVTIDAGGALSVTSTLTIADGTGIDLIVIGTLNLSGNLGGNGSVVVNGIMNWTGGTMSLNVTNASSATLTVSSGSAKTINSSKTLLNQGMMNWSGGDIQFNAGTLENQSTIMASSDNSLVHLSNSNLFNNTATGTFTKSSGTGTTIFGIPVTNAGNININSGTLQNRDVFTNDGNMIMTSASFTNFGVDATCTNNGNFSMTSAEPTYTFLNTDGATYINNGIFGMTSTEPTYTFVNTDGATYTNNEDFSMTSAEPTYTFLNSNNAEFINNEDMTMSSPTLSTITNSAGSTVIQNSSMTFTGPVTLTTDGNWQLNTTQSFGSDVTINQSGVLDGTGIAVIYGVMTWTSGYITVNTTIAPGAILTLTSGWDKNVTGSSTLTNQGTMYLTGGRLVLQYGTFQNEGSFIFNNPFESSISTEGGTNLFNNTATGVFTKSTFETCHINVPTTNAGIINLNSGTLNFTSTTIHTGTINAASGTTLQNSSNFTDNGTINITSSTLTNNTGDFTQNNLINFTGTVTINNHAIWNMNVAQVLNNTSTLNLSRVFNGSGSLEVNGVMNWPGSASGGYISINTLITAGATLVLSSGHTKNITAGKTLTNRGTINWTGGRLAFQNGTLQNEGSFNQTLGEVFGSEGGINLFHNAAAGIFTRSGTGTSDINIPVTNAGTIKGTGTISFVGSLVNNGTISPGSSPGILTINGNETFGSSSILNIELQDGTGPGTGHDQLQRAGNLTLAGTLNVSETGIVPAGSYTIISLTSGTISGSFSATNLPAGYSIAVNSTTVVLTKAALQTFYQDADADTYGNPAVSVQAASAPIGYVTSNTDCNDGNASIHPGATEVCDGVDNNCDGNIDEGFSPVRYYQDADNDNYGNIAISVLACTKPAGYVTNNTDCDDTRAFVNPAAIEIACNGIDDDCDGNIDEIQITFYRDVDGDGFGKASGGTVQGCIAPSGYVANGTDCNDNNAAVYPGATETCNGIDDNCNEIIDDGLGSTFYGDDDGDGFGDPAASILACTQPIGYVTDNMDCDDFDNTVYPGALEICDGKDNDCDGSIDEGLTLDTYYQDTDNDGYGNAGVSTQACSQPSGYVTDNTDCDDTKATVHPGATEACNGIDDDCDGSIDETAPTWYQDFDNDGYGNPAVTTQACTQPAGYVLNNIDCNDNNAALHAPITYYRDFDNDTYGSQTNTTIVCSTAPPSGYVTNNTDCDDTRASVNPTAIEIACNGIDDDCDGNIDEIQITFYRDVDGDGFGNPSVSLQACTAPTGFVANNLDCDDTNAAVNPNTVWYLDADNDNYYMGSGVTQCTSPATGYRRTGLTGGGDCNDNNAAVHPGATELCTNIIDDDCDNLISEGCPVTISIADVTVLESAGLALVQATLSVVSASTVTVKYKTMNGTAQQRKDYTSTTGTLTFLPGQTSKNISVPVIADAITEGNENFFIEISKPMNATIIDGKATITITETAPPSRIKSNPITEVTDTGEIKLIIPNPQRKQEQLRFFGVQAGSFDVVLIDVNGKVVAKLKNYRNNWSMVKLIPGIYFYQVRYKNQEGELIRRTGKLFITE